MRIAVAATDLALVHYVLSDHNIRPVAAQLPVIGGVQYVDLTSFGTIEQLNVLNALKQAGVAFLGDVVSGEPEVPPFPVLTALMPATMPYNIGFNLQVQGANFQSQSWINFDGKLRSTVFTGPTSLSCSLSNRDGWSPGEYPVYVVNPGGQLSNVLTFVRLAPS